MTLYVDFLPEELEATPARGPLDARVAFVGSAPGLTRGTKDANEPFGSSSLALIHRIEKVTNEPVYLTNLVKLPHSSKKKVPKTIVRKHYPALIEELNLVKPKRILALGQESAETLCPGFKNLREDHGTMFFNPDLDAYVIPTFHFSSISRDATNLDAILHDARRLFELPDPVKPEYKYLKTASEVKTVMAEFIGKEVTLDIETTGLSFDDELIEVGFTGATSKGVYIVKGLKLLRFLMVEAKTKDFLVIGHNLQFDLSRMIHWADYEWWPRVWDTMVTAHVLGERSLSLKHLTSKYTDRAGSRSYGGPGDPEYVAEDVLSTRAIYEVQKARLAEEKKARWILPEVNAKVAVLANIQKQGVFIDREHLKQLGKELERKTTRALKKLNEVFKDAASTGPINWNSSAQLASALELAGVKLTEMTDAGAWKMDEATLLALAERGSSEVQYILSYREAVKEQQFVVSYLELTSDEDPYLRPRLRLTGTETGRLSCSDPNLQQVPREGPIKLAFRSRHKGGKMGLVDLSQAELRVVALLSGDEVLMKALLDGDPHLNIAASIFRIPAEEVTPLQRKKSKGVTFGLLYGGGAIGLASRIGVPVAEVEKIIEMFFAAFKKLAKWIKTEIKKAQDTGLSTTIFGRTRDLNELMLREGAKGAARKATNTPVQSIASDCDLIILGATDEYLRRHGAKTRPVLGVHDSIIFDIYPGEEDLLIEAAAAGFAKLNDTPLSKLSLWGQLPLVGELVFGTSWATVESTNINYAPERKTPLSSNGMAA